MAETSVLLNISSMIDLAIGTPEVGVVDFGMLHTVLHCLAQQLKVLGKNVELRGSVATLPVGRENIHTIDISEYVIDTEDKTTEPKSLKKSDTGSTSVTTDQDTILVVERKRKSDLIKPMERKRKSDLIKPTIGPSFLRAPSPIPPVTIPPQGVPSTEKLSLVTISKFNILENTVQDLKDRVYGSMPKNEEILEEVRSQTNLKAITDMWTSLNVSSRLEAAEAGLAKLSSLVQDLISDTSGLQEALQRRPSAAKDNQRNQIFNESNNNELPSDTSGLQEALQRRPAAAPSVSAPPPQTPEPAQAPTHPVISKSPVQLSPETLASKEELTKLQAHLDRLRGDLKNLTNTMYSALADIRAGLERTPPPPPAVSETTQPAGFKPTESQVSSTHQDKPSQQPPPQQPPPPDRRQPDLPRRSFSAITGSLMERLNELEKRINVCCENIGKNDGVIQDQINSFQDQIGYLLKQVSALTEDVASGRLSPDFVKDLQGLFKLFQTVQEMQEQLKQVHETALELAAEKEGRNYHMNALQELKKLQADLDRLREDFKNLTNTMYSALADIRAGLEPTPPPPPAVSETTQPAGFKPTESQVSSTHQDTPSQQPPPLRPPPDRRQPDFPRRSFSAITGSLMERLNELEKRINVCCESIGKNDGVIQDQINSFQDQIEYLLKQVSALTEDLASGRLSPDLVKDLQGLLKLFQTVQEMQEQLKQVHETALELAAEKEGRNYHMNALLEQIELLKTIKLDREDMVEAMADKADMRLLARKVSHDQFELACDDLSRGLEHALGKLNLQEAIWQQALDDIQREIEMKLDKMELSPVKDFFNTKLKQLQDNLKQMASLRREVKAAGTKQRLLREVNCISCDANAVMPMEPPNMLPVSRPMPATISMKPYLSYELDTIRKAQATNVPQRNLHDWENIDKQIGQQKQLQKARSDTGKHLCNRYCGGSHTTTTPAQRVARTGHFVKQWGPDVVQLSSGLAAGDDGRMYKVSPSEGANVGPGGAVDTTCKPKYPKRGETPKAHQQPILVAAPECRCLEEDRPAK